jgi:hypothetical protein
LKENQPVHRIIEGILAVQPVFAVPVYFSVLSGSPPLWLSLTIAIIPLGLRFWLTSRFITRTPFDVPILIFLLGMLVGLLVASNKGVAVDALGSTLASILIYYGLVSNSNKGNRYWLTVGGVICLITLVLGIWFFSEGTRRITTFNAWFFPWFEWLPKTGGSVLQFNSLGALLAVVVPGLGAVALFPGNRRLRVVAFSLGLLFLVMLVLSASGGGWIAAACGLAFVFVSWRSWMALVVVPLAGIVTAAAALCYGQTPWLQQTFATGSLVGRVTMWSNTIQLFHGRGFVAGLGLGSWTELYNRLFRENQIHIHNAYLQLYTDTGVLGVIAFVAATVVFVHVSRGMLPPSRQDSWHGVRVGMISGVIAGAVMATYEVATTVTVVGVTSYVYLSVPFLWVWAALFAVWAQKRLARWEAGSSGDHVHPEVK